MTNVEDVIMEDAYYFRSEMTISVRELIRVACNTFFDTISNPIPSWRAIAFFGRPRVHDSAQHSIF